MIQASNGEQTGASGWPSRLAAGELLHLTLDCGADLDRAMDQAPAFATLEGPDRGFARAIAGAGLRAAGRIDWALGGLLDRPLADIEPEVRALLRAGCAQLWLLGVADHAAVSATVEAARRWRAARRGGGLVNAVLRRAAREKGAFAAAPVTSVWPDWISARLASALGPARAQAMARLHHHEPPTDITLKPGEDPQMWAQKLGARMLPGGSLRLPRGVSLAGLAGYSEGLWWVQDAAAALPARLMGDVAGRRIADLCAAPGGKAMQLAAMGARLSAVDVSAQRLARLRENAARARLSMEIIGQDARTWRPDQPLDGVLLDAPCSALGVLRRHPEGLWRRNPRDLARFAPAQAALLAAAGQMLRAGGRLVYSVCTPAPEEGCDIVTSALASGHWRRLPIEPSEAPGFSAALTPEGDLLTAPGTSQAGAPETGADGADPVESDVFYIARLERT